MPNHPTALRRPAAALLIALLATGSALRGGDDRFIEATADPSLYHDGWIDLNKNGALDPYENPALDVEARIDDLLARMTLEEKTNQMAVLYGFPRRLKDRLPTPEWSEALWKDGIGTLGEHLNGNTGPKHNYPPAVYDFPYSNHARAFNDIQRWFIEDTRLGIPVDFTNEGIRGLLHTKATSFPAGLAVASAWDPRLAEAIGEVTGREARALGYTNVFAPILDVARDPRWGRVIATYGEDPFLVGELGAAQVRGIQREGVVSTVKHFAVYGIPKGGRDGAARTDPHASWRDVQTLFLPPFKRAIRDAGALSVMASYNDYDGIPIEANRLFLTDILRQQWGFQGYIVSDASAVEILHTKHRVADTPEDAIIQAINAGLDVRLHFRPPEQFIMPLRRLAREGLLATETIDARVRNILRVKFWSGTFDQPYIENPRATDRIVRAPEHLEIAHRAARESIVLLKNEGDALPLSAGLKSVLVTGPMADNPEGWWFRYGPQHIDFITPLEAIREKLGNAAEVRYVKGVNVKDANFPESDVYKAPPSPDVQAGIDEAVAAAEGVDVIIAVLGEDDSLCSESHSRISLNLPGYQQELLEALYATGKPVVLALSSGRPLSINWADHHIPAILEMWFPGEEGGAALADILFGDVNPSGRLPITFPKSVGQIPFNFPARPGSQGRDGGQVEGALYPFGYGLSYTTFAYDQLRVTPEQTGPGGTVTVSCEVTNTGKRAGDEVVQLYLRDDYASVITFEKQLRGFTRVHLAPGETRSVSFTLGPRHLELYDRHGDWIVEPGRFTVWIGASSTDLPLEGAFEITAPGVAREAAPPPTDTNDPR